MRRLPVVALLSLCTAACIPTGDTSDGEAQAQGAELANVRGHSLSDECPNGGVDIELGIDENADGQLSADEVDRVVTVCNGTDGAAGRDGVDGNEGPQGPAGGDGVDGVDGDAGPQGPPGADGTSCTVVDNGDGTKTITCGDVSVAVADGADGQNGATGNAGPDGTNGLTSLIRLEPELGGPNCPYSGTKILTGIDDNDDGVLQGSAEGDQEVDQVAIVCSTTPGACATGYHSESEGGACVSNVRSCETNGTGEQTWAGSAWNSCVMTSCDGGYHLDAATCVSDTRSCPVANGTGEETWDGSTWGPCAVTKCANRYSLVDGVCTCGVGEGDVSIGSPLEAEALAGCTSVSGNLTITAPEISSIASLGSLITVEGDLVIRGNLALTSLQGLEHLRSIGGTLEVSGSHELTNLRGLNGLISVGGSLYIGHPVNGGNAALTALAGLDALHRVLGDVFISNNSALPSCEANAFTAQLIQVCGVDITCTLANNTGTGTCSCGDSVRNLGEGCDDGNTAAGDGCTEQCQVGGIVINEVDYDNPGSDTAEFVEIYNGTGAPVSLAGYALLFFNGNDNSSYRKVTLDSAGTLAAGGFVVVHNAGVTPAAGAVSVTQDAGGASLGNDLMQNGAPDGIALVNTTEVVDVLAYEGAMAAADGGALGIIDLGDGTGLVDEAAQVGSLSRKLDGGNTGVLADDWAYTTTPTPGAPNQM